VNKFFRQMWADIKLGKNLTVHITILASFVVFVIRLFGYVTDEIVGKLLLLSVGLLLNELLQLKTSADNIVSRITKFDHKSHIAALEPVINFERVLPQRSLTST